MANMVSHVIPFHRNPHSMGRRVSLVMDWSPSNPTFDHFNLDWMVIGWWLDGDCSVRNRSPQSWKNLQSQARLVAGTEDYKLFIMTHMQVSWNRGTPKSSILIGLPIINHPFGDPPFTEPPISIHLIVQKKVQNHRLALEPWSSCSSHKQNTRWCPRFVNWFITPSKCRSTIDPIVRQLSYWVHQLKHQWTINPNFLAICLLLQSWFLVEIIPCSCQLGHFLAAWA